MGNSNMSETSHLDRRTFLVGAGVATGVLGISSLLGCSTETTTSSDATPIADTGAEPLPEPTDTLSCDIVVVGGGISGLCAAVEGAQQGAHVILVEKQGEVGGNSLGAEGPFALDSVMQQEAKVELSLYDALKQELEFSNYRSKSSIWINFLKHSGENISWLMDNGVPFAEVCACKAGLVGWHKYDGGGKAAVAAMLQAAQNLGVEVLTMTPMTHLIEREGGVAGIFVEREGEPVAIEASAVILASGGTGANTDTLSERTGFDCSNATVDCSPGNTGDGMDLAVKLGADTRTACIMGDKCVYGFTMMDDISFTTTRQPILWVNERGERFVNEGIVSENIPMAFNAIFLSQQKCFSVVDQASLDAFTAGNCPDLTDLPPGHTPDFPQLPEQVETALASSFNNVFKADTVEALAEQMGADPAVLAENVNRYNELCHSGEDVDFFKRSEFLVPVETGPFYAFKMDPLVVCAIGGLCTDSENRVLNTEGAPIPNLYAVGLDGCNLYEETYNMGLGGSANGYCIYSGRNAARSALGLTF